MKWVLGFVIGALCAAFGCLAAGVTASFGVEWFHVSGFEGYAGFFVVYIALGGLMAGFVIGLTAGMVVLFHGGGFGKALGIPLAIVLAIGGAALGLSWFLGDVPPKLGGEELFVQVEIQCPPEWQLSNKIRANLNYLSLESIGATNQVRHAVSRQLRWEDFRSESGRTVIPGELFVFTSTGRRGLTLMLGQKDVATFLMPLPGHPTEQHQQWSEWLPKEGAAESAGGFRYRFRVVRESDRDAEQEAKRRREQEDRRKKVEALSQSAPLADWLALWDPQLSPWAEEGGETNQRVMAAIEERSDDLAGLLHSGDDEIADRAMAAVAAVQKEPRNLEEALHTAGRRLAARIRDYGKAYDPVDPDTAGAVKLKAQFQAWANAWARLHRDHAVGAPAELEQIAEEVRTGPKEDEIGAIGELATYFADQWQTPAAAP